MICNICGTQEATIHLTEIVNNQMVEIHLCETCAQEKGTDFKTHFNFGDLLAGLGPDTGKQEKGAGERRPALRCGECGMSYEDFGKTGRLGCAACYTSFSKILSPLIKRVQRANHHLGKRPSKMREASPQTSGGNQDLKLLQERLRKSIQTEAFEEAARLRDEIKQAEEKMKKGRKAKNE